MSENVITNATDNKATVTEGLGLFADVAAIKAATDNLSGLDFELDKIKMPAGGSTAFEIPGDDGELKVVKDITGVIVYNHASNAYYKDSYAGGSAAPDCSSGDGITGTGEPGGICSTCPLNQFGSGAGRSKACKNKRILYVLMEGELFPVELSLPAGSLKEFGQYAKRQLSKGRTLDTVLSRISIKKATNGAGISYSQAVFTFVRELNNAEKNAVKAVTDAIKRYVTVQSGMKVEETKEDAEENEMTITPLTGNA